MSGFDFQLTGVGSGTNSSFSLAGTGRTPLKELAANSSFGARVAAAGQQDKGPDRRNGGDKGGSTLASFLEPDVGGRWSDPSSDELLQAKIEHLERERVELSLQIHLRDEKERARKIKIEQMESQLRLSETSRTEAMAQLDAVRREKEVMERRLQESNVPKLPAPSASAGTMSVAASIHAMVDSAPPAYLSGTEATQGLWSKMTAASRELRRLEEECRDLKREKEQQLAATTKATEEVDSLKAVIEKGKAALMTLRNEASESSSTIQELEDSNSDLTSQLEESRAKEFQFAETIESHRLAVQDFEDRIRVLESDLSEARGAIAQMELAKLETERQQQKQLASMEDLAMGVSDESLSELEGNNPRVLSIIEDLRKRLYESEQKRKKLNNTLQELRGNVRVLVRCRPFLRGDGENHESSLVCNRDGTSISLVGAARAGQVFSFDSVFNSETSQENVYSSISELVQSAIDGYRVCVFSYGQTGSGKTWTMSGDKFGTQRGIIPRSVEQVIQQAISMRENGWEMSVSASVVELYNEELRDLLAPKGSASSEDKEKLKICNVQGRVTVSGLTQVEIDSSTITAGLMQLDQVLETAKRARVTISTGMNEQSSRSHMLFMLEVTGKHKDGTTITRGGLRLVDLAGSERLDRTGTANDAARLKETVNINKSLSCLADVFMALGNKQQHIPYRNSKLTMLLQDCMSGDGKALMIVDVSPTQASAQETLCSLRFAAQVRCSLLSIVLSIVFSRVSKTKLTPPPPPPPSRPSGEPSRARESPEANVHHRPGSCRQLCAHPIARCRCRSHSQRRQ